MIYDVKADKEIYETILSFFKAGDSLEDAKKKAGRQFNLTTTPRTYHILLYAKEKYPGLAQEITAKNKLHQVRSLSGVVSVAVLTKNYPCPYKCAYCPKEKNIPQSYLKTEPAVARAKLVDFDPYKQVKGRLEVLELSGHEISKIELIILGGTFSAIPNSYRIWFVKRCFDAANSKTSKNLSDAQKLNEKSKNRIIGITIETRPDLIDEGEIKFLRRLGVTRVELGAQNYFDFILNKNNRGTNRAQLAKATKMLKNNAFKITYHLMLNLPGSNPLLDFWSARLFFIDSRFRPDQLKIYPLVVVRGSEVYKWYKAAKFSPYSQSTLIRLLADIKAYIPKYVRIIRVIRDIPSDYIEAGNKKSNLRQNVQAFMKEHNMKCKCIRCQEIKNGTIKNPVFKIKKYRSSGGREMFISIEGKDSHKVIGFLRLFLPKNSRPFFKSLKNAALIREIHTYGEAVGIDKNNFLKAQHHGYGSWLINEAQIIVKNGGYKKIAVIAGVGVRNYFRKQGYELKETYMVKNI